MRARRVLERLGVIVARKRGNTTPAPPREPTEERERVPYRKLELGMWTDLDFTELSAPQPCGQWLWVYLLTGKRTTPFPGLVVAREAVMADDLRWSLEAFRDAFGEAFAKGMVEADWNAGVVVLRKALFDGSGRPRETSRPTSPNQIRGWAKSLWMIPDCELTREYLRTLEAFSDAVGNAFGDAFRDAFRHATRHPSPTQETGNRKQEREKARALSGLDERPFRSPSADPEPDANASVLQSPVEVVAPPIARPASSHPDPRIKLNHDAWSYAADTHRRLRLTGIDPNAISWTAMPSGAASYDLVERTREILANDPDIERALALHRRRIDVAAAEAELPTARHLKWFTPSRIYAKASFWKAAEMHPSQVRSAPRSQTGEPERMRADALGADE